MSAVLPLFPDLDVEPSVPALVGIGRLAADAEPLDQRNTVRYAELEARSVLSRCSTKRLPFEWTLNPYRGCEYGCQYCYARYTHEFMELRGGYDFERMIFVKRAAAELLRRDLRRVRTGERIALGTATDPYQPAERRYQVTRSMLEVLAEYPGLRLGIISKSDLMVRDIDLLRRIAARSELRVRFSVTTVDTALARALEPRAPRPDLRLRAAAALAAAGIEVGVMCAPVLPAITDGRASLERVAAAAKAAGARYFNANPLFLQPCAQARYFPFLEERFPDLVARYRRAFARSAYLPVRYHALLRSRVEQIRSRLGFAAAVP